VKLAFAAGFAYRRRHSSRSGTDSALVSFDYGYGESRADLAGSPGWKLKRWLKFMQIMVRDNNVEQALRALKKKLQREGVYREMKLRRHYEKPSEKRAREKAAAIRRARKLERKRAERDGVK
jgi:small subunit ribosomal protein S21